MSGKLILHIGEKNVSSWSMRPFVALAAKGVPFEERTIEIRRDKTRAKRREIGPTGKLPVLHHVLEGGQTRIIPDSLAIIEYVEEVFTPPSYPALWPADVSARAQARWMAAAMHSGFAQLRESMSFNLCFLPQPPAATPAALAEAAEMLGFWETALGTKSTEGDFLCGPFGAVDAMYAPAVVRLTAFKVPTEATPRAAAYMQAVLAHPAVKRWMDPARALPPLESY